MKATNKEARNRADSLQDSKDAAERLRLKEDLGMKVSARERRLANEKIEREEKQFAQSLQFKYDELDASIQDSIRDSISTGTLSAADYNSVGKMIGDMTGGDFVLGPDGKYTRIGGIDLTPGMQNKINSLMGEAYSGLARSGSLDVFNAQIAPEIASQINAILPLLQNHQIYYSITVVFTIMPTIICRYNLGYQIYYSLLVSRRKSFTYQICLFTN